MKKNLFKNKIFSNFFKNFFRKFEKISLLDKFIFLKEIFGKILFVLEILAICYFYRKFWRKLIFLDIILFLENFLKNNFFGEILK